MPRLFDLPADLASEVPALRLGLAGFNEMQCKAITCMLAKPVVGLCAWQISPLQLADGWLLCGEKSAPTTDTHQDALRVAAGLPGDDSLILNLSEVTRPLAFSLPLASTDIEARLTFSTQSESSLYEVLSAFEQWLTPLRSKFVLGSQLMERESQLKCIVYHVSCRGQLLAILDFSEWRIGLLPDATSEQFEKAVWEKRPPQANAMPAHFVQSSVEQLRWVYAQHTQRDALPLRYQLQPIYFAQTPNVPQTWLEPAQLLLLRELSIRPATLQELTQRTLMTVPELNRHLACLYFAGSLTTTPEKAATRAFSEAALAAVAPRRVPRPDRTAPTIFNSTLPPETAEAHDQDRIAPAGLQRH